jgi:hypothetical protein
MHRSRAPSIAPGTFFVAQPWADCITNMPGFNLRQAQPSWADFITATPAFKLSVHTAERQAPVYEQQTA